MPEGHTLRRLAQQLQAAFAGSTPEITSPQGRFHDGAALLNGQQFVRAWNHGKLLFCEFEDERTLYVHLGLIGKFPIVTVPIEDGDPPAAGPARLRIALEHGSGRTIARLYGPMTATVIEPEEIASLLSRQGPDPLDPEADPDAAWAAVHASGRSIGALLMDQKILAGVGNVYRCEILFRNRINPATPGSKLKRGSWEAIWADLVDLMAVGVKVGRIVTDAEELEDIRLSLARGEPVQQHVERIAYVYQRTNQPCRMCGSKIRTATVAGRNLFWCGNCQRRH
ncbi:MAG: Fpg/Nei family DNA glycosylase [Beutenbergiaceae bacterium]